MGAIAMAVLMIPNGVIEPKSISPIILLLLALAYFLGGVHLERPMLWLGLLLAAGYFVVLFAVAYAWTILGIATSIALALSAMLGRTDAEAKR